MFNQISEVIVLPTPTLQDEAGKVLVTFQSASIVPLRSGYADLHTDPIFLPDTFPVHDFGSPNAPALYLVSGLEMLRVKVVGGCLALAPRS